MKAWIAFAFCLFVAGCEDLMSRSADVISDDESRVMIDIATDAVLIGDIEPVLPLIHPQIAEQSARQGISQIIDYLPDGEPDERDLIGFFRTNNVISNSDGTVHQRIRQAVVMLRYGDDRYGLLFNLFARDDEPLRITNFTVVMYDPALYGPPAELTVAHQVFRAAAIGIPIFVVITLAMLFRLKRVKRRILWTLFIIIVCYPVFQMNWSTGDWSMTAPGIQQSENRTNFSLVEFTFFGGAALRASVVDPWIISAAIPLGAILFWLKLLTVGIRRKPPKIERNATVAERVPPTEPNASREQS